MRTHVMPVWAMLVFACASLLSGEASAKFAQLQKHDAAAIKSRCDSVGGKFSSTYFTYRCKTSTGTVKCSTMSHNCKGYCDKCGTKGSEKLSIQDVLAPTNQSQCPAALGRRILNMGRCLPR
jgi:uncharacterized membrane protein